MLALKEVCTKCKKVCKKNENFCLYCGTPFSISTKTTLNTNGLQFRSSLLRRFVADLIDRLIPLPFLTYLFPEWIIVVIVYHLFCDSTKSNRSIGKYLCRLRIVSIDVIEPCGFLKATTHRFFLTLCQVSYCTLQFYLIALTYEFLSVIFLVLNPQNRSWEDCLLGTQIIRERDFRRAYRKCFSCKQQTHIQAKFCPLCGIQQT